MADRLFDTQGFVAFCEATGLRHQTSEDGRRVLLPHPTREGWAIHVVFWTDRPLATLLCPLPGRIPTDRIVPLLESAARLNARILQGAWVVEPVSAEMAFRITVDTDGVRYPDETIGALLERVLGTVDAHVPELDAVLKGAIPTEPEAAPAP